MKPLSVALTGADGQLGRTITADWSSDASPAANELHGFNRAALDITDPDAVHSILSPLAPDIVINAAAYTAVDRAESERDLAMKVNRDGARNIAEWARDSQCRLIHISTDFVFDGKSSIPYCPDDAPAPLSVYGESKLAGEQAIGEAYPQGSIIVRTGWLYSALGNNFVKTMLRLMRSKPELTVVADQNGTPTSAHSLANLITQIVTSTHTSGIYHWSDAGETNWYEFAKAIQEEALVLGLLDKAVSIKPISSEEYPTAATRPANSVMDKSLSYAHFKCNPVPWRENLKFVLSEIANCKLKR
jgi:dTDP-4-dehydrorhamnose reductase